jgi:hypothetical protein
MKALQSLIPNSNKVSRKESKRICLVHYELRCNAENMNSMCLCAVMVSGVQTDKASMLDEVIEYLKQLQLQVQVSNRSTCYNCVFLMQTI